MFNTVFMKFILGISKFLGKLNFKLEEKLVFKALIEKGRVLNPL